MISLPDDGLFLVEDVMKKKICVLLILVCCIAGVLYAQSAPAGKFDGIWTVDDDGTVFNFFFFNDTLTIVSGEQIITGTFSISSDNMDFKIRKKFSGIEWSIVTNNTWNMKFRFSGEDLILIMDNEPLTLVKIN